MPHLPKSGRKLILNTLFSLPLPSQAEGWDSCMSGIPQGISRLAVRSGQLNKALPRDVSKPE